MWYISTYSRSTSDPRKTLVAFNISRNDPMKIRTFSRSENDVAVD